MATEELTTLIDVSNINEKAYNYIKTNIINLTYPPGYNLNLGQLSEKLGVSPTPIKDALFRLSGEGLVEIAPRKGTYVKELSLEDIHEIVQIRIILETAAVEAIVAGLTDSNCPGSPRFSERCSPSRSSSVMRRATGPTWNSMASFTCSFSDPGESAVAEYLPKPQCPYPDRPFQAP